MKLRYRLSIGLLVVMGLGIITLGFVLSHDSECPPPASGLETASTMKSIQYHCYGSPEVLRLENVDIPQLQDNEVLVKVKAASVNPLDWHFMRGKPYIMRLIAGIGAPRDPNLGVDFAGTVEAVGSNVTRFRPGEQVFGSASGAFGEYVRFKEERGVAIKPVNISHKQAAAVPIAGVTALQGLRDHGQVRAGQKVLINGASGGVGTFAVQIAKAMGAEVTGICSTRNVELVRSIGADYVIDYTRQDFTQLEKRYDVILDNVGNHSIGDLRRVMEPKGTLVTVGTSSKGNFIGPLWRPLRTSLIDPFVGQQLKNFTARMKHEDMVALAELMRAGELTPVIDQEFSLRQIRDAISYSESGHARAKIVIDIQ
ncbi:MAG TPA: NAD(P)-dependent alcohol dehydrogenase [Xanthomonadales bacterium]|nr:NAD(P)-dependent alcohol dehydrogenase [Xanthomonadales bacterium]